MRMHPPCDLFVLAAESSGDAYAAALVAQLKRCHPDLVVAAMGGPALQAAGAEIEEGIDGLDVMGFVPVLARLGTFVALQRRVQQIIRARRPRLVLSIDYPGFNLRLHRSLADLRQAGTRLVHIVAPQVWAWRPRRAKRIAASVDHLLCFFPFEPPLFARFGADARFIGHPLVDLVATQGHADRIQVERELGLAPGDDLLLLAPGSRRREVEDLLPVFHAAARLAEPWLRRLSGGRVVIAVSSVATVPRAVYRAHTDAPLVEDNYRGLCARARMAVVASGTATLEAALLGLPHVIAYRGDALTMAVMRRLIRTPHIGLTNIVHNRRLVPELLQRELTPARLAARMVALWRNERHRRVATALATTAERLGGGGALARAAELLGSMLSEPVARPD